MRPLYTAPRPIPPTKLKPAPKMVATDDGGARQQAGSLPHNHEDGVFSPQVARGAAHSGSSSSSGSFGVAV